MIYSDPGEHARENSRAEGANKIIEAGIQCLLYEKNLPRAGGNALPTTFNF